MLSPKLMEVVKKSGLAVIAICLFSAIEVTANEPAAQPAVEVTVMQVDERPASLTIDIVGEIKAFREVDLRSRVSGNLMEIAFRPGQEVKKGDLLFVIDPGPYQAAVANAKAGLAQASASLSRVMQDVERYKPLLPDNAIPRQVYDQAVAQAAQEKALVASRKAAVERAQLDLEYTRILSPLDGRIGLQQVEVGALVSAGQTELARVATLDPMVVYFSVAETEYLTYMKRRAALKKEGKVARVDPPVELILSDGSRYSERGVIDFTDPAVNPTTGTLTLRAVFTNPDNLLKAGMNSRVRVYYEEIDKAILVPQKSVTETLGKYFITVIGEGNKAEMRAVQLGPRMGDMWLVTDGLQAGENIVVEGVQKARPGIVVTPIPAADTPSTGSN